MGHAPSSIRLSIVVSVYNSHEAVRRQALYWRALDLGDDVEFLIADDGSNPPLAIDVPNLTVYPTGNRLAWTQGLGRNLAASYARGKYLLCTDIDHILSREAIEAALKFDGNKMTFPRYFGVLLEDGTLTQDLDTLVEYGFDPRRLKRRGLYASVHGNTWVMDRETFAVFGGYSHHKCTKGYHPGPRKGEDCYFNGRWNRWARRRGIQPVLGPPIYVFPVGKYHVRRETNPMGLFHDLGYEQEKAYKP